MAGWRSGMAMQREQKQTARRRLSLTMKPLPREIPYLLRITALIIFFNGLFSLIRMALSPFSADGFFPDPRIVNVFIGLGLMTRKKTWYVFGVVSVGANIALHIVRLAEFASTGIWTVLYFMLALSIDVFQIYVLLHKDIWTLYFIPKPHDAT